MARNNFDEMTAGLSSSEKRKVMEGLYSSYDKDFSYTNKITGKGYTITSDSDRMWNSIMAQSHERRMIKKERNKKLIAIICTKIMELKCLIV